MAPAIESIHKNFLSKRCATCRLGNWRRESGQSQNSNENGQRSKRDLMRQMAFGRHLERLVHRRMEELLDLDKSLFKTQRQSSSNLNYLPLKTILFVNNQLT